MPISLPSPSFPILTFLGNLKPPNPSGVMELFMIHSICSECKRLPGSLLCCWGDMLGLRLEGRRMGEYEVASPPQSIFSLTFLKIQLHIAKINLLLETLFGYRCKFDIVSARVILTISFKNTSYPFPQSPARLLHYVTSPWSRHVSLPLYFTFHQAPQLLLMVLQLYCFFSF